MTFKLTYSTMFEPPEEMHERFEAAPTLSRNHAFCERMRPLMDIGILHGAQLKAHRIWLNALL